jgi:broad specificity phosphatase PhoE
MEIVLIRHGKPSSANNPMIKAYEYANWIRRYNSSDVAKESRPKYINDNYKSFYIVSSDLKRAVHSANIYVGKPPEKIDKLYREMEIPRYKFPFQLKAWNWVYFSRFLWIIGYKGPFESFKEAKQRAENAALKLIELAQQQNSVVLFGHGFMNRYIRKSLIQKGWALNSKDNAYWGITSLENQVRKSR